MLGLLAYGSDSDEGESPAVEQKKPKDDTKSAIDARPKAETRQPSPVKQKPPPRVQAEEDDEEDGLDLPSADDLLGNIDFSKFQYTEGENASEYTGDDKNTYNTTTLPDELKPSEEQTDYQRPWSKPSETRLAKVKSLKKLPPPKRPAPPPPSADAKRPKSTSGSGLVPRQITRGPNPITEDRI